MRLTLIQNDAAGGARLLFSGMPDQDGFYRDQDGTLVGRAIGNSFMLDNAGVAAMNAARSDIRAARDPYSLVAIRKAVIVGGGGDVSAQGATVLEARPIFETALTKDGVEEGGSRPLRSNPA